MLAIFGLSFLTDLESLGPHLLYPVRNKYNLVKIVLKSHRSWSNVMGTPSWVRIGWDRCKDKLGTIIRFMQMFTSPNHFVSFKTSPNRTTYVRS